MNQEEIIELLRENGGMDIHMLAARFYPEGCSYEIKHDTRSKVYSKLRALRKYDIVRPCEPYNGERTVWELVED